MTEQTIFRWPGVAVMDLGTWWGNDEDETRSH